MKSSLNPIWKKRRKKGFWQNLTALAWLFPPVFSYLQFHPFTYYVAISWQIKRQNILLSQPWPAPAEMAQCLIFSFDAVNVAELAAVLGAVWAERLEVNARGKFNLGRLYLPNSPLLRNLSSALFTVVVVGTGGHDIYNTKITILFTVQFHQWNYLCLLTI